MIDPKNLAGTAQLVFADEFDSLSLWNGASGRWATKYPMFSDEGSTLDGNGEQQWYVNHLYGPTAAYRPWSVANGILTLEAMPVSPPIQTPLGPYGYVSGMISSYNSFNATYGYFEMRAKLPKGQGLWPAFWMLPQSMAWPPEIDVMEFLGREPTRLYTTVHTKQTGVHTSSGWGTDVPDLSLAFHDYGVDWQSDYVRFFFDGVEVFRTPTPSDMHQPMYVIANLAVGGYWPGMADASTPFPSRMEIDHIRVYKEAVVAAPAPEPAPAPTTRTPRTRTRPKPRRTSR